MLSRAAFESLENRLLLTGAYAGQNFAYQTATDYYPPVVQDLNGDGKPDLVVLTGTNDDISIELGSGGANFAHKSDILTTGVPTAAAVADFNGDKKPDLVFAIRSANQVMVCLGNGDGTFQAPKSYLVGTNPDAIIAMDANGDGKLDLAVANAGSGTLTVLHGDGAGNFATPSTLTVQANPNFIAAADLNGDKTKDLAVSSSSVNTIDVLLSNGSGGYGAATPITMGSNGHYNLALQDINNDGKPDLITTSDKLNVRLGSGGASFGAETDTSIGSSPEGVEVGNFDADVKPDLFVNGAGEFAGNGDGTFATINNYGIPPYPFALGAQSISRDAALADLNGDGLSDVISAFDNQHLSITLAVPISPTVDPVSNVTTYHPVGATVNKFVDNLLRPASTFTATINWGDNSSSTGTAVADTADGAGHFSVQGTHTYLANGTWNITTTISDTRGNTITETNQAFVNDAPPLSGVIINEYSPLVPGSPADMAPGPAGEVWYSDLATQSGGADYLGLIGGDEGSIAHYQIATTATGSLPLASDSAGNAWYLEPNQTIARMDPAGNVSTHVVSGQPFNLARGADGNIWFLIGSSDGDSRLKIGTVANGTVVLTTLSQTLGSVTTMAIGPDGNFWAVIPSQTAGIDVIARITPQGVVTPFSLPYGNNAITPYDIAAGADGNLWFTAATTIGRMTTSGVVTLFPVPSTTPNPQLITSGSDGAMWFTDGDGRIGRITTGGTVEEIQVPSANSRPYGIAASSDGNIWFGESGSGVIGKVSVARAISLVAVPGISATLNNPFSGLVANFTDPAGGLAAGNYLATINWGDQTSPSTATVAASGNEFSISATHTYSFSGTYNVQITVQRPGDANVSTSITATVGFPMALAGTPTSITTTENVSTGATTLVTFTTTEPDPVPSDFSATVQWGDGTSTNATIVETPRETFQVDASHDYTLPGTYTIATTILSTGYELDAKATATVVKNINLQALNEYSQPVVLQGLSSADFNGDGVTDLAGFTFNALYAYLNPANGKFPTFGAPVITNLPSGTTRSVPAIGDFNGDGRVDVAVAYQTNSLNYVKILLGNGNGTFTALPNLYSVASASQILVADVNKDGNKDLVLTNPSSPDVSLLIGHGDGTFSVETVVAGTSGHSAAAVDDYTGDGIPDLALTDVGASQITILPGIGNSGFAAPLNYPLSAGFNAQSLLSGDFNGDHKPDLALTDPYDNALDVLLNNGSGGFAAATASPLNSSIPAGGTGPFTEATTVADLNGDGIPDLIRSDSANGVIEIRAGVGNGTFLPDVRFAAAGATQIVAADLDHDGRLDLAASMNIGGFGLATFQNAPLQVNMVLTSIPQGQTTPVNVADLTDLDDLGTTYTAASFNATINWGDGSGSTTATLVDDGNGGYFLQGPHAYQALGQKVAMVVVHGPNGTVDSVSGSLTVTDAPLHLLSTSPVGAVVGEPFTAPFLSFTDADSNATASSYTATINWGDGTLSLGTIAARAAGGWTVFGTHIYSAPGSPAVSVTVNDVGGSSVSGSGSASVVAANAADGAISGTVYVDANLDGVRQAGELGLPLSTVYVDSNNNGVLDSSEISTLTAADGSYTLTNVPAGAFVVRQNPVSGYGQTAPSAGARSGTLTATQFLSGADFGDAPQQAFQLAGTGSADAISLRMDPDQVHLDAWINVPTTGAPTRSILSTLASSIQITGGGGADALTIDNSLGTVPGLTFSASASSTLALFGAPGSDIVSFNPINGQIQFNSVSYSLNAVSAISYSSGGGGDSLSLGGSIPLTVNMDGGNIGLTVNSGSNAIVNFGSSSSSLSVVNNGSLVINVGSGNPNLQFDTAAVVAPAPPPALKGSISGYVFNDFNANGDRNYGEKGLAGHTVYLDKNHNGKLDPGEPIAITAADGSYHFGNLADGSYLVREILPAGWRTTRNSSYDLALAASQNRADKDFALTQLGVISGRIYCDSDAGGKKDSGEASLAEWVVYLDANHNGKLDPGEIWTLTDAAGDYHFNIAAGSYEVRQQVKPGLKPSSSSNAYTLKLTNGQIILGEDFEIDSGPNWK